MMRTSKQVQQDDKVQDRHVKIYFHMLANEQSKNQIKKIILITIA